MLTASFSAQNPEAGLVCSSSSAVIELMIRFFCFWQISLKNSTTVKLPASPVRFDAMRLRCCEALGHCRGDQLGELAKVLGGSCE